MIGHAENAGLKITGLVLAGGLARRMGGQGDKGLQQLGDKTLLAWVLARFAPQVDQVIINANQNIAACRAYGYPVLPDVIRGFAGPLAGLHACLQHLSGLFSCAHPVEPEGVFASRLVATVPCDSPFLPLDLVARLSHALQQEEAELAVARTAGQIHPVFALYRATVFPSLQDYLAAGEHRVQQWQNQLHKVDVWFDDQPEAFANINTPAELAQAENRLIFR